MSTGTLYTTPGFSKGKRILAAAAFAGLKLDVPTDYVHFQTNKTPEFINKFSSGKIPAFEDKDGFRLFETTAIARYIASLAPKSTLLGSTPKEAALVDQWISFADLEIGAPLGTIGGMLRHFIPYNKGGEAHFRSRLDRALKTVDTYLSTTTYLVGERISLADITMASVLQGGFAAIIDKAHRDQIPHLVRYYETVVNQKSMKDVFGETTYVEKSLQYTAPPKEKKEEKPKAEKKEEKPKEEKKPKEKAKKEDEEDEEDDLVPQEPKEKNPLDSLPKSSFNLEDWKRAYSNMETKGAGGSVEWFYDKYDKEGYSIWKVNYKYNEDLTQTYMSSNLIGGFFNRLEASRKYLFGSLGVLGKTNDSVIAGVFIARGPEIQPVVEVAPDWESYSYERIDPFVEGDNKKFFEDALAWDLAIDGKSWVDGKNFK